MKILALRTLIKEAISDMEVSLELGNGTIIHGIPRKNPRQLNLQIGKNNYFSFWEGEFASGGNKIVKGVDDRSQEWLDQAVEEYKVAERDSYPEKYGLKEDSYKVSRPTQDQVDRFFALTQNEIHYLNSKPVEGQEKTFNKMEVEPWDEYDLSNWNSLVRKAKQQGKSIDEGNDKIKDPVISETYNDDGRNPYNGFLSTDDTKIVIVRSNEDWEKLATSLGSKGFKHNGSLNPLNPNKGLTQMSNYAKFPYEVVINKTQKVVDFGEHTLNENKMTKENTPVRLGTPNVPELTELAQKALKTKDVVMFDYDVVGTPLAGIYLVGGGAGYRQVGIRTNLNVDGSKVQQFVCKTNGGPTVTYETHEMDVPSVFCDRKDAQKIWDLYRNGELEQTEVSVNEIS
jgi:hypothetical protein